MMKKIKKILDHYGEENQIRKTIEELDELKEALEEGHNVEHIIEECTDVMIMLNQLSLIYDFDQEMINAMTEYKVERTLLRIREACKQEGVTNGKKVVNNNSIKANHQEE